MQVVFTKTGADTYTTVAIRDDGVRVHLPGSRPRGLPHDLAHFVVERELGLEQGFWGCVSAGAVFPTMQIVGRKPFHGRERSRKTIKKAADRPAEAEALVPVLLDITRKQLDHNWPAALSLLRDNWTPPNPSVDIGQRVLARVCGSLRECEEQWRTLPLGESIVLTWSSGRAGCG